MASRDGGHGPPERRARVLDLRAICGELGRPLQLGLARSTDVQAGPGPSGTVSAARPEQVFARLCERAGIQKPIRLLRREDLPLDHELLDRDARAAALL